MSNVLTTVYGSGRVPYVRTTCPARPGVPWSVHGPKMDFSNAFVLGRLAAFAGNEFQLPFGR